MTTQADEYRRHEHAASIRMAVLIGAMVIIIVLMIGNWRDRAAHEAAMDAKLAAVSTASDALREQVIRLGGDPIAPPSDEVIEDPTLVEPPAPISSAALELAARSALADVLPGEVGEATIRAVKSYVAACVASGECVGPAGTPGTQGPPGTAGERGATGAPPGPEAVAAAVLAVCSTDLDCTVTDDEILAAVATYCGASSDPCGRWTEAEILRLATRATVTYLSGRGIWCPPLRDFPPDEPYGPCFVSSG